MRHAPDRRRKEAGLTSDAVVVLLIGAAVVATIAWFAFRDAQGTENEARAYAERTLHRLCFAHDAGYFGANLSARGHSGYPESQQRLIIYELTHLGVPTAPLQISGTFSYGDSEGEHHPEAHYEATTSYANADAHFYLDISRQVGGWRIDYFTASWKDKTAPAAPSSL
jgi:hypothetical protein